MFTNLPGNETWQGYQMISIITSCTYCSDQRGVIRVKWVPFSLSALRHHFSIRLF